MVLAAAVPSRRDISRVEDYLEAIYNLDQEKGYISASDISERLKVKVPTVSSMVGKLAKEGYLVRERYRGMKLTEKGTRVARSVIRRHETIFELLSMLGLGKEVAYEDAEGIEHHLHPTTIQKFERMVEFLKTNPEYLRKLKQDIERD
jgi:Mn-dependent DtxR family transcriptional regulator